MIADMRERGEAALKEVSEDHLPTVVRLLELLAKLKNHPDVELEKLLRLAKNLPEDSASATETSTTNP